MTDTHSTTAQRSYPNRAQRKQLAVEFGHARWAWSKCLAWRGHLYKVLDEICQHHGLSRELAFLKKLSNRPDSAEPPGSSSGHP